MPKNKPTRHVPTVDMTAMCDVAFLLLTFFMLTAKAKPQEPVAVDTPSSISETKLPEAGTLTILVDSEGKVYLDMAGQHTRLSLINDMESQYPMGLSEDQKLKFTIAGAFGVPTCARAVASTGDSRNPARSAHAATPTMMDSVVGFSRMGRRRICSTDGMRAARNG